MDSETKKIVRRYQKGETEQSIALSLGVGTGYVRRRLVKAGVERRGRQEAARLRCGGPPKTRSQIRLEVLAAYGGKCACCGQEDPRYLTFDHVNDDGGEHRKTFSGPIYVWLRTHNYPEGFQVLCANCNMSKAYYGGCDSPCRAMFALGVDLADDPMGREADQGG